MEHRVDLATWPRAPQFHFFRTYTRPHFSVTSRLDVTHLMTQVKPTGTSPYRASLYAIGAGLHAVPELLMRFRGDTVIRHDAVDLSMTVPTTSGSFTYAYMPFDPDLATFEATAQTLIQAAATKTELSANLGDRDDVAYLSCMPWLDYTSLTNAMPGPDDCIPRIGWGKITGADGRYTMPVTAEVHHALADGAHVGAFFSAAQVALDTLPVIRTA